MMIMKSQLIQVREESQMRRRGGEVRERRERELWEMVDRERDIKQREAERDRTPPSPQYPPPPTG